MCLFFASSSVSREGLEPQILQTITKIDGNWYEIVLFCLEEALMLKHTTTLIKRAIWGKTHAHSQKNNIKRVCAAFLVGNFLWHSISIKGISTLPKNWAIFFFISTLFGTLTPLLQLRTWKIGKENFKGDKRCILWSKISAGDTVIRSTNQWAAST